MKIVLSALALTLFLALGVAVVEADETVVLACTPDIVGPGGNPVPVPPVYVTACDKSAGVPVACPPPFFFLPGQQAASCAQTLAAFLSLPGYKVVNVQPGAFSGGAFYTIAGSSRNQQ
jgi:hypothetical protein